MSQSGPDDQEQGAPLPEAASALLAEHSRSFLMTLRADGSPTAHPMTALRDGDRLVNAPDVERFPCRETPAKPTYHCCITASARPRSNSSSPRACN